MPYLDASLVTTLITTERRTARALDWLIAHGTELVTSEWTLTEVASALSIKQRRGDVDPDSRAAAERALTQMTERGLTVVPVRTADFRQAADFARRPELNLRGGDALHLAVASRHRETLHSLDAAQVAAARELGIDAVITVERE